MAFSSLEGYMEACMCGVFGVYGHSEAAKLTYLGLHALQHRGQESAGIISTDGKRLYAHRAMGLVHDTFTPADLAGLPGSASIGHVRYSTAGGSHLRNAQPLAVDYARGSISPTRKSYAKSWKRGDRSSRATATPRSSSIFWR
jgi:glutamine phosphoribosylpyrophosphate amidotransferase